MAGFTLLELLVSLAILALVAGVALPALVGHGGVTELHAAARAVAAGLRYARSDAVYHNHASAFVLDAEARTFSIPGDARRHRIPADVRVALVAARRDVEGSTRGAIRFYPDGSSTGGRVALEAAGRSYLIDVDWLTGRIRVREGHGDEIERHAGVSLARD